MTDILHEIEQSITTIGFPIICVIFLWKNKIDIDEKQTQLLGELTNAINNLTDYIKEKRN